jgi:hypothetical protein
MSKGLNLLLVTAGLCANGYALYGVKFGIPIPGYGGHFQVLYSAAGCAVLLIENHANKTMVVFNNCGAFDCNVITYCSYFQLVDWHTCTLVII